MLAHLAPTPAARQAKAATTREKGYLDAVERLFGDGAKAARDRAAAATGTSLIPQTKTSGPSADSQQKHFWEDPDLEAGTLLLAVDLAGRAPEQSIRLGERAVDGLGAALLRMGAARLAAGARDDVGQLVPEYVTLPRGISRLSGEVAWSRGRQ